MGQLTALKVKRAKPGKHSDGNGLLLVVSETGAGRWVLRIRDKVGTGGKRRDIGLGSAADVSLAEARTRATDMRRAFKAGRDPVAERKADQEAQAARDTMPTFRKAAEMVHAERKAGWRNEKHARQWLASLERHVFPEIGDMPVDQIDAATVRNILAAFWLVKPETARRTRQRIGAVLDYAHAQGWRSHEAPMRAISRGLPRQQQQPEHFAALPWRELPAFVAGMADTLKTSETIRLCIEFTLLTACRSGESRGARWNEFDLEGATWTIPADRTKSRKPHRVPLAKRAIEILERMAELRRTMASCALVFEGSKPGRPLSDMSLTAPLRRAGLTFTLHGTARSSFRDWCSDVGGVPREIAERCLAHIVKNRSERAYSRSDLLDQRRVVMKRWADFLAAGQLPGNVADLDKARQTRAGD